MPINHSELEARVKAFTNGTEWPINPVTSRLLVRDLWFEVSRLRRERIGLPIDQPRSIPVGRLVGL
jgi:hypothetical protein